MKLETKKNSKEWDHAIHSFMYLRMILTGKYNENVGMYASMCKYRNLCADCSIIAAFECDMKHQYMIQSECVSIESTGWIWKVKFVN